MSVRKWVFRLLGSEDIEGGRGGQGGKRVGEGGERIEGEGEAGRKRMKRRGRSKLRR